MWGKTNLKGKISTIKICLLSCLVLIVLFFAIGRACAQVNEEISFEEKLTKVKTLIVELKSFPDRAGLIEEVLTIYSKKVEVLNNQMQELRRREMFFEKLANLYKVGEGGINELRKETEMLSKYVDSLIAENARLTQKIKSLEREIYESREDKYKQEGN